ncbi:hypothetical protein M0805_000628 [Coniferiporia weirii]|nr:hypothetical protein M0805_000628 [Coniferiporia weirii]
MPSPAAPGLFFCFAAAVLLIFVSVSAPTWNSISFLDVSTGGQSTHFGVFGYTGSGRSIGYFFPSQVSGASDINTNVLHNLTKVLILHPVGAGLAGIAVLFGLCGAMYHRSGTVLMSLAALLAFLVTLIVWIIDMVLFGIVRDRIRNAGGTAQYGNANWLTLGALVSLALAFCAGACGTFGRYRRRDRI